MMLTLHREPLAIGAAALPGELILPAEAIGVVLFAHGSGSSRASPRNRWVAQQLHERRIGTVLFDLLTPAEAADRSNVFDVTLLADRLREALDTCSHQPPAHHLPFGLFGASTGAAAALSLAAVRPDAIHAVVSRGGRPDLAQNLAQVRAPTLLIVGGEDLPTLRLNRAALRELACRRELAIVDGATHLFEEPGTLEVVAQKAGAWFQRYLTGSRAAPSQPLLH
jgi:pimeloyl-ACP methyl ester carboxylesterase